MAAAAVALFGLVSLYWRVGLALVRMVVVVSSLGDEIELVCVVVVE